MATRFGPSAPRCSQIEAEPGPPLKTKHTGRSFGSASSRKYEVVKTAASGSPRLSSRPPAVTGTNAATALYFRVRPFSVMLAVLWYGACASSLSTFSRSRFLASSVWGGVVGSLIGTSGVEGKRNSILRRAGGHLVGVERAQDRWARGRAKPIGSGVEHRSCVGERADAAGSLDADRLANGSTQQAHIGRGCAAIRMESGRGLDEVRAGTDGDAARALLLAVGECGRLGDHLDRGPGHGMDHRFDIRRHPRVIAATQSTKIHH